MEKGSAQCLVQVRRQTRSLWSSPRFQQATRSNDHHEGHDAAIPYEQGGPQATLDTVRVSDSLSVYEKAPKHQYRMAKQTQIVVGDFDGERINSLPSGLARSQHYLLS